VSQLRGLAFHTDVALRTDYVRFTIPKKSGGLRTLSAPRPRLEAIQRKILAEIAGRLPATPWAHGFVTGRSILTNAREHVGKAFAIDVGLK